MCQRRRVDLAARVPVTLDGARRTAIVTCDVLFVDERPLSVDLPSTVALKVIESADGIKGDTASNVQKPAKVETGLTVQVPLFIKEGETIRVSTVDGSYLGRV